MDRERDIDLLVYFKATGDFRCRCRAGIHRAGRLSIVNELLSREAPRRRTGSGFRRARCVRRWRILRFRGDGWYCRLR